MRITPDHKDRNDGYDKNTVRFYESLDKDGYFYELYVLIDDRKARIIVVNEGVWVDFLEGDSIHTNITPDRLFQNKKLLFWEQLLHIIKILEKTALEGKSYTANEMTELYEKWQSLGEP